MKIDHPSQRSRRQGRGFVDATCSCCITYVLYCHVAEGFSSSFQLSNMSSNMSKSRPPVAANDDHAVDNGGPASVGDFQSKDMAALRPHLDCCETESTDANQKYLLDAFHKLFRIQTE